MESTRCTGFRPKVSVIVAVYRAEAFIERCARSLFAQTLDSIEFLFIDDCSPDDSITVLKRVLDLYPLRKSQTRIIKMPENSGQAKVRFRGIREARGEYIVHCDSDDWVDNELYEALYNKAKKENADIVAHPFIIADGSENRQLPLFPFADLNHISTKLSDWENEGSLCNKLIRSELFMEDITFPIYNFGEDMCIVYQLIYYAKKVSIVNGLFYYIYCNDSSITRARGENEIFRNFQQGCYNCRVVEQFYLQKKSIDDDTRKALKRLKYSKRDLLRPLVAKDKYHKIWCNTFPEIDKGLLVESAFTVKEKLRSIVIRYKLLPL